MRRGNERNQTKPNRRRIPGAFGMPTWSSALALAVFGALAASSAEAQQPDNAPAAIPALTATAPPDTGPAGPPVPSSACAGWAAGVSDGHGPCAACDAHSPWQIYMRAGSADPIGKGQLAERMGTGWTVQAGFEEKVSCPFSGLDVYFDFGAGYLETYGTSTQAARSTSGNLVAPRPMNPVIFFPDFFFTKLGRFRRTDLHSAFDFRYHPTFPEQWSQNLHFETSFRAGARVSAVGISYDQQNSPSLQAQVNQLKAPDPTTGAPGLDPRTFLFLSDVHKTDYAFGLFSSLGGSMTYEDVRLRRLSLGTVQLGFEVEFANDWINAGALSRGKKNLWTISPLVTLAFSF